MQNEYDLEYTVKKTIFKTDDPQYFFSEINTWSPPDIMLDYYISTRGNKAVAIDAKELTAGGVTHIPEVCTVMRIGEYNFSNVFIEMKNEQHRLCMLLVKMGCKFIFKFPFRPIRVTLESPISSITPEYIIEERYGLGGVRHYSVEQELVK